MKGKVFGESNMMKLPSANLFFNKIDQEKRSFKKITGAKGKGGIRRGQKNELVRHNRQMRYRESQKVNFDKNISNLGIKNALLPVMTEKQHFEGKTMKVSIFLQNLLHFLQERILQLKNKK